MLLSGASAFAILLMTAVRLEEFLVVGFSILEHEDGSKETLAEQFIEVLDTNRDGLLQLNEVLPELPQTEAETYEARVAWGTAKFREADENNDGNVDVEEARTLMKLVDEDGDL
mmetsp:Transcript_81151/g.225837  ORF Transcript_81151/g.225837 Transcript_81151/m.225837 type:complete len:114 (-) Transcript_81151:105-446(-)